MAEIEIAPCADSVEDMLDYMHATRSTHSQIRYENMRKLLELIKDHSGESWNRVKNLAGSQVGVGERSLNELASCFEEWGTILRRNGKVYCMGIPKGGLPKERPPREKGKPFLEYDPPPESPPV